MLFRSPDNADAWVFHSHLMSSVDEKVASLQKALDIDPNHAAARVAFDFLSSLSSPRVEEPENEVAEDAKGSSADDEQGEPNDDVVYAVDEIYTEDEAAAEDPSNEFDEYIDVEDVPVAAPAVPLDEAPAAYDPYATVTFTSQDSTNDAAPAASSNCPFCGHDNHGSVFQCGGCDAVLSLSELEAALSNPSVRTNVVAEAVEQMQLDRVQREFSVNELIALGLGHLNLRDYDAGFRCLQDASRLAPNDVVLSSQVNALAIRLDEISRQREFDEARPKGRTILVVDDSATVRKLIAGKLEKSGHNVVCAADGVEALERIAEQVPDLILLDITMPRMDG